MAGWLRKQLVGRYLSDEVRPTCVRHPRRLLARALALARVAPLHCENPRMAAGPADPRGLA